jgi:hypothetical protein
MLSITVQHDIRHGLPEDTAKAVARKAVEAYGERFADYSFKHKWANENRVELSFTVAGKTLVGALNVLPEVLRFELDVPFIFKPFSGQAVKIIEREAVVWIERARKGELI